MRPHDTQQNVLLQDVRTFDSGYCIQTEYLTGRPTMSLRRFHAMFLHFRHPHYGEALIDTGYSPRFFEETRRLPGFLHRVATPVPRCQSFIDETFFDQHGMAPNNIKTVFLSHFHADHIAGLHNYPNAKIVCDADATIRLRSLSLHKRIKTGMLPGLLPNDFMERSQLVHRAEFTSGVVPFESFRTHDVWGDDSLLMVDLPGHAHGHLGFLLNTSRGILFYVADAYWDIRVLRGGRSLPKFSRGFQHDWKAYQHTQEKLRTLDRVIQAQQLSIKMYATHCPVMFENRWPNEN